MPDSSVRLMVMREVYTCSWDIPDGFVWDIHSYVEVACAGRLCLAHGFEEVHVITDHFCIHSVT